MAEFNGLKFALYSRSQTEEILAPLFKSNRYASFKRQLNNCAYLAVLVPFSLSLGDLSPNSSNFFFTISTNAKCGADGFNRVFVEETDASVEWWGHDYFRYDRPSDDRLIVKIPVGSEAKIMKPRFHRHGGVAKKAAWVSAASGSAVPPFSGSQLPSRAQGTAQSLLLDGPL